MANVSPRSISKSGSSSLDVQEGLLVHRLLEVGLPPVLTQMRVGDDAEREGLAGRTLRPERVLRSCLPVVGAGRLELQAVVVLRVGAEPVHDHFDRFAAHAREVIRLPRGVLTCGGSILEVRLTVLVGDDVGGHGVVGGPAEQDVERRCSRLRVRGEHECGQTDQKHQPQQQRRPSCGPSWDDTRRHRKRASRRRLHDPPLVAGSGPSLPAPNPDADSGWTAATRLRDPARAAARLVPSSDHGGAPSSPALAMVQGASRRPSPGSGRRCPRRRCRTGPVEDVHAVAGVGGHVEVDARRRSSGAAVGGHQDLAARTSRRRGLTTQMLNSPSATACVGRPGDRHGIALA